MKQLIGRVLCFLGRHEELEEPVILEPISTAEETMAVIRKMHGLPKTESLKECESTSVTKEGE